MFEHLGIDAFTALGMVALGSVAGMFMALIQLVMQVIHDKEGFGWKYVVIVPTAFSAGFGLIVFAGGAIDGTPINRYLGDSLATIAVMLPTTLIGGLVGRISGWLVMRTVTLFSER